MNAVGTHPREHAQLADPPGSDADAWFSALDDRTIALGSTRCTARVMGIHSGPDGLWIQLSCESDTETSVVVHVTAATRVEDVLHRLEIDPPVGCPLEILDMHGPRRTPSATLLGRAAAAGARPMPRHAH